MTTTVEILETTGALRSLKNLEGYHVVATDGIIGKVHDFFFDDSLWAVRYVVVDTGHWLPGRKVLLPPGVLQHADWRERSFQVPLTREQVRSSPDIDTDKPVSRQREIELYSYYGWAGYWTPAGLIPGTPVVPPASIVPPRHHDQTGDPHLRSVREVTGYDIEATDGLLGRVDDFIADDAAWILRYLVVATHKWLPGRKVLIAPQWLAGPVSWSMRRVKIILTRESIQNSPEYDPTEPVNRDYEAKLFDYYGRPRYWTTPDDVGKQTQK